MSYHTTGVDTTIYEPMGKTQTASREPAQITRGEILLVAGVGLSVFLLCSWGFTRMDSHSTLGETLVTAAPAHMVATPAETSGPATAAHMVATLDFHGHDGSYETAVDDVLARVASKCNSNPREVGAKALCTQNLLKKANVSMSLREILDAMDAAVPLGATWLDVNYAFVMYYVARQKHSSAEAIAIVRKVITDENSRSTSNQSSGHVNYSLIGTLKDAWHSGGWRYKSKEERTKAITLIVSCVESDCPDPTDREATLDYIERTIEDW